MSRAKPSRFPLPLPLPFPFDPVRSDPIAHKGWRARCTNERLSAGLIRSISVRHCSSHRLIRRSSLAAAVRPNK